MTCGLLKEDELGGEHMPIARNSSELAPWIDRVLNKLKNPDFAIKMGKSEDVERHIKLVKHRLEEEVATLVPEYRKAEEQEFQHMVKEGVFRINRHIVKIIHAATTYGWSPIGYSDRPGISLGLTLDTSYKSWPEDEKSMIARPVPLISVEDGSARSHK
jgi:hypothetical protein